MKPIAALRRFMSGPNWWIAPLLFLLVPIALVLFFLWNTPDFANFEYKVY